MANKTSKQLERYFKGVANHRRIAILRLLDEHDELSLEEISEATRCNVKTTAEHTRRLLIAGLIGKKNIGRFVVHSLSPYGKLIVESFELFNKKVN